jgi:hypothetical protein
MAVDFTFSLRPQEVHTPQRLIPLRSWSVMTGIKSRSCKSSSKRRFRWEGKHHSHFIAGVITGVVLGAAMTAVAGGRNTLQGCRPG